MIPLLIYSQVADLITFLIAANTLGIGGEYNFLIAAIYANYGPAAVVTFKVFFIALLVAVIEQHYRLGRVAGTVAILAGSVGALVNVIALAVSV